MKKRKAKSARGVLFLFLLTACGAVGFFIVPEVWFNYTYKMPSTKKMREIFPNKSQDILKNANEVTLFSLEGSLDHHATVNSQPGEFHGYPILGKTTIEGKTKQRLMAEIYNGLVIGDFDIRGACFNPHHGVRASFDDKTTDCLICFSCGHFLVYMSNSEASNPITKAPEKFFNQLLQDAGVPFDPDYKH